MMQDKDCSVLERGIRGWERDSASLFKFLRQEVSGRQYFVSGIDGRTS